VKPQPYKVALNAVLASRKIHARPKLGKNGKPGKTVDQYVLGAPPPPAPPPREVAPQVILSILEAGARTPAELKKLVNSRLHGLTAKDYAAAILELLEVRKVHAVHKRDQRGKLTKTVERYAPGKPAAEDFIAPLLALWKQAKVEAFAAGVEEPTLITALLSALSLPAQSAWTPSIVQNDLEILMSGLRELVGREGRGALIAMRRLRSAVSLPKERFNAAVLELYTKDRIILHHHDYVGSLSESEREELVVDQYGNYFVGAALAGEH